MYYLMITGGKDNWPVVKGYRLKYLVVPKQLTSWKSFPNSDWLFATYRLTKGNIVNYYVKFSHRVTTIEVIR